MKNLADWRKNQAAYRDMRDQLLGRYQDQWIAFADGAVIASGTDPSDVFKAAEASGRSPFITCVGDEDEPVHKWVRAYEKGVIIAGELVHFMLERAVVKDSDVSQLAREILGILPKECMPDLVKRLLFLKSKNFYLEPVGIGQKEPVPEEVIRWRATRYADLYAAFLQISDEVREMVAREKPEGQARAQS